MIKLESNTFTILTCMIIISSMGILSFVILKLVGMQNAKSMLFEILVILLCILVLLQKIHTFRLNSKIETFFALFIMYIAIINVIFLLPNNNFQVFIISNKEIFLMPILIYIFQIREVKVMLIYYFISIINVINLLFTIVLYLFGYDNIFTQLFGYTFYGKDIELGFKISHISGLLRSPGLIGESAAYGFFSVYSFIILYLIKPNSKLKYFCFINLILSLTRSAYIAFIVFCVTIIYAHIHKKVSSNKLIIMSIASMLGFAFIVNLIDRIISYFNTIISLNSIGERSVYWNIVMQDFLRENTLNKILYGTQFGLVGSVLKDNSNFLSYIDSTWLFVFINIGLTGLIIWVLFIIACLKKVSIYTVGICLCFIVSGFFTNLLQGEVMLIMFPLTLSITRTLNNCQYNNNFSELAPNGVNAD